MRSPTETVVLTTRGREAMGTGTADLTARPPAAVSPTSLKLALNVALLPGAAKNSNSAPPLHSKKTNRTGYRPAGRLNVANVSPTPRGAGNSNESVPISQRKPSSELTPKVHNPLVGMVILPMA